MRIGSLFSGIGGLELGLELSGGGDYEDMVKSGMRGEDFRIIWEEASRLLRRHKAKVWRLAKRMVSKPGARVTP